MWLGIGGHWVVYFNASPGLALLLVSRPVLSTMPYITINLITTNYLFFYRGAFVVWARSGHAVIQENKAAMMDLLDALVSPTEEYMGLHADAPASAAGDAMLKTGGVQVSHDGWVLKGLFL